MESRPPYRNRQSAPFTISAARRLRRDATEAESLLWLYLRARRLRGFKFRRQAPIGQYIADFACFHPRLVVEVDGSQHTHEDERDAARTAALVAQGYRVLRFWNNEVLSDVRTVVEAIEAALLPPPPPTPSPWEGDRKKDR